MWTLMHYIFGPFSCRPNQVAEKVAARISENFSEAAIVMVIVNHLGWLEWTLLVVLCIYISFEINMNTLLTFLISKSCGAFLVEQVCSSYLPGSHWF